MTELLSCSSISSSIDTYREISAESISAESVFLDSSRISESIFLAVKYLFDDKL